MELATKHTCSTRDAAAGMHRQAAQCCPRRACRQRPVRRAESLETALRCARSRGELALYYQPQVDLKDGRMIGAEALVRWDSPEYGQMPPSQFIPLAERTGLIVPLGEWVIERACQACRLWTDGRMRFGRIAINLSACQFSHGDVVGTLCGALDRARLDPALLEVELTETALMENLDHAARAIEALRRLGIKVSLDDFGTGYSSLAYLVRLPLDMLKMDQRFVRDIAVSEESGAVAETIIALAHRLGLRVVAEGIETPAQLDALRRSGCDIGQGFLFSQPVPTARMTELIAADEALPML